MYLSASWFLTDRCFVSAKVHSFLQPWKWYMTDLLVVLTILFNRGRLDQADVGGEGHGKKHSRKDIKRGLLCDFKWSLSTKIMLFSEVWNQFPTYSRWPLALRHCKHLSCWMEDIQCTSQTWVCNYSRNWTNWLINLTNHVKSCVYPRIKGLRFCRVFTGTQILE